jgi:succinate dehydrogenase hydrophobic anchor subunit
MKITIRIYKIIISLALILELIAFLLEVCLKSIFLVYFLYHIWTFVTNVITVYIHSNTLQLLMNVVVHVQAFKSGLVSGEFSTTTINGSLK